MEEVIKFTNRDGNKILFRKIDPEWYEMRGEDPELMKYTNIVFNSDDTIYAVDPPGGPFISVGHEFSGYQVKDIRNTSLGIYIKLGDRLLGDS